MRINDHNYALACVLAVAVVICAIVSPTTARAFVPYKVKTIAVETARGLSAAEESETTKKMRTLLRDSKPLDAENIRATAMTFLNSKLQGKVAIIKSDRLNEDRRTTPDLSLMIRLDFSVWPYTIEGKSILLGTIALTVQHSPEIENSDLSDNRYGWQPSVAFTVSDNDAETQANLEAAIARLLVRYATLQNIQQ